MSNLIKRSLSGTIYVLVFVGCIIFGASSYCILFAVVTALALNEWSELIADNNLGTVNNLVTTISGVYLFLALFCICMGTVGPVIFLPYLLSILFIFISELYQKRPQPIANLAYTFIGQIYIALPFSLLNLLAIREPGIYSAKLPLAVFIFLWINDSGAYCFGSILKKKFPYKLFERISPHKTWVGSIGGGIVVLLTAIIFSTFDTDFSFLWWLGLGAIVVIFATWGDLIESMIKRQLGIKDSGKFLPGHGGVLDRFDSALLAIPASVIYVYSTLAL